MRVFSVLLLLLISLSTNAQDWFTSFDQALSLAKESDRNILMVFEGSDWCAPCRKLEKKILKKEAFLNFAAQELILLKVDFPRKKKNQLSQEQQTHNNALAEEFNPQAIFPTVVLIDHQKNELGRLGYEKISVEQYIEKLKSIISE